MSGSTAPAQAVTFLRAVSAAERAACLALRLDVFVHEQHVPREVELDQHDEGALHFLAVQAGAPVGTARVVLRDEGRTAKIGRVAVRQDMRRQGVGAALMQHVAQDPVLATVHRLMLESQVHAVRFYERLGYTAFGDIYLDAGIPHRRMERMASQPGSSTAN